MARQRPLADWIPAGKLSALAGVINNSECPKPTLPKLKMADLRHSSRDRRLKHLLTKHVPAFYSNHHIVLEPENYAQSY